MQFPKALLPILVTELGTVMEVRPLHPEKAEDPILVKELDNTIDVRPLHL